MKNRFSNHYSKYKICYITSVAIVAGIFLSTYFSELFEFGDNILTFNFSDIYLLFIIPIYSIFYGIVTYIKVRKIWIPQLIFFIIFILGYLLLTFSLNGSFKKTGGIFILCIYPLVFSLFSTIVTAFIFKMKKLIEK